MPYRALSLLVCFLIMTSGLARGAEAVLIDDFEQGLRPQWKTKSFQGETEYLVVADGAGHVLQARSQNAASGLTYSTDYLLQEWPLLHWRWKVKGIIPAGDERQKATDDFAARVYVIFPHWFFPKTRTISYVWANRLTKGSSIPSPYTGNAMIVAVESGAERVGAWMEERRNVREDYLKLFGEEPPAVGAIAIMTDTDNTGSSAEAWYDDLRRERP